MKQIDNISNDASQEITVILDDGTSATVVLSYLPAIERWLVDISWDTFSVKGVGLCVHPNILRTWRKLIPFGLTCQTTDGADPFSIDDFEDGRASLYVLSESEVAEVESDVMVAVA